MSKQDQASAQVEAAETTESLMECEEGARRVVGIIDSFEGAIGKAFVSLGMFLDRGAYLVAEQGHDWRDWAKAITHRSQGTVYRIRNAGAVARVLDIDPSYDENGSNDHLPGYLTLVPFYKILADAKAENRGKAEEQVRKAWAKLVERNGGFPTQEQAEKSAATILKRGTRGAAASELTEETERNEPTETDSPSETVEIDPAKVEAVRKDLAANLALFKRDLSVEREAALTIMSAAYRLTREHGIATMGAVFGIDN